MTIFNPENDAAWLALRKRDVTSTQSAMLFGLSPYGTAFELWHNKKDDATVADWQANERMDWGNDLQDGIANSFARKFGVVIRKMTEYISLDDARMGSSFDYEVVDMIDPSRAQDHKIIELFRNFGPGILEIKNVDYGVFRDKWQNEDKTFTPPGHIDVQVQHQLHVSGRKWAAIGVLVGGNTGKLVIRERDHEVGAALESRIRAFWQSIQDGIEPPPIYPGDAEFVMKLYGYAEPGRVFDGRGNEELAELAAAYKEAGEREKLGKEDKDIAKAKMLQIIGDAERAVLDGYTVSAGMVAGTHVEYDRQPFRNWRITEKK